MCKFPDKTRQRKTNLSEEDCAAAVISTSAWNSGYEDEEDSEGRGPQQQQRAPLSAGASVNGLNPGQMTLWDCLNPAPAQGFKRPNAHGRDKSASHHLKRAKIEHGEDGRTTKGTSSTNSASTSTSARPRASMPPPLGKSVTLLAQPFSSSRLTEIWTVTRPHSSANSLRKPFKTPFKVPSESRNHPAKADDHIRGQQPDQGIPSPPLENQHTQKDEESENVIEIVEVQIKQEPTPPNNDTADDQSKSN